MTFIGSFPSLPFCSPCSLPLTWGLSLQPPHFCSLLPFIQIPSTFLSQLLFHCCSPFFRHALCTPLLCTLLSHSPPFPLNLPPVLSSLLIDLSDLPDFAPLWGLSVCFFLYFLLVQGSVSLYIHWNCPNSFCGVEFVGGRGGVKVSPN